MSIAVKTIEKIITLTAWSFENAKDHTEVQNLIVEFGYNNTRLDSLIRLSSDLGGAYQFQQEKRAEQVIAYKDFEVVFKAERRECTILRALVKKVLPIADFEKYAKQLGLDERLKITYVGFDEQARKIYTHVQRDTWLLGLLERFGVTAEKITPRLDALLQLKTLNKTRETQRGLAEAARRERDIIYKNLKKEWGDFKDICGIVFEDKENPQYQELVGINVPSEGYVKRTKTEPEPEPEPEPEDPPTEG